MTVNKASPQNRRKSIAVLNQNKPLAVTRAKRRAHSIVPGDRLSPLAKARRSLVPRKSILKTFTNIANNGEDAPSSQQSQSSTEDGLLSNDITNATRKSLGRRVSFANRVEIRVIKGKKSDDTDTSMEQDSSPVTDAPTRPPTDENAYSRAVLGRPSRSSIAYSEDMDLTAVMPSSFPHNDESALMDEEFDCAEGSAMDMTEALYPQIIRKQSLSMGNRVPLAQLSLDVSPNQVEESFREDDSQVPLDGDSDLSQVMEFTMPLNHPLRAPPQQDETWLALRQATHSGNTPIEPELSSDDIETDDMVQARQDMELEDAVQRLMRARQSLPSLPSIPSDGFPHEVNPPEDETFSSMDDSYQDDGNQTMNMSKVFGHPSDIGQMGMESTMDESGIYGAVVVPTQSTPQLPNRVEHVKETPLILAAATSSQLHPITATPSTSTLPSVFRALPQPVFTAPPQMPLSPKVHTPSLANAPALSSPSGTDINRKFLDPPPDTMTVSPTKRPRSPSNTTCPSPPKRNTDAVKHTVPDRDMELTIASFKGRPLSPIETSAVGQAINKEGTRPSLRRPSDYFARRKSLVIGSNQAKANSGGDSATFSPVEKASSVSRHVSIGGSSPIALTLFGKTGSSSPPLVVIKNDQGTGTMTSSLPPITGQSDPVSSQPHLAFITSRAAAPPVLTAVDISRLIGQEAEDTINPEGELERWRSTIEPTEPEGQEQPTISIQQFFTMTGIKFMDEITAPRRSMHHSQRHIHQPRAPEQIALAEYVIVMGVDVPQLALYSRVSKDLQAWIVKSKADFVQAEDEAAKITPELFIEFSTANEEGQAELLHQLQLIRTNARASAKSDWYDWKLQWLEGLRVTADETFKALESDARALDALRKEGDGLIPLLKEMYNEVMEELEREQAEAAEIEASDQDYLNELKASIAEQNTEVEALRAEVAEARAQLIWVRERQAQVEAQKQEAVTAIADATRLLQVQQTSTRSEVFRLKARLEALEDLHMLRITKVSADLFQYVYASIFCISLPCKNFVPIARQVDITRISKTRNMIKDHFPQLNDFLLHMAKQQIVHGSNWTIRKIVQRLNDYWSSCQQLRTQLKLVTVRYPLAIEVLKEHETFKANVTILFHPIKAKAIVSFWFDAKTLSYWPTTMHYIRCDTEVIYGNVDRETILNAVTERLSEAAPGNNYGCLLDACILAQEIYN